MNEQHKDLFGRIAAFPFDEGTPAASFAARLARENGWDMRYALRVIEEYRRFAFLLVAAGHMAVPSDQVDQAWHLHVLDTRSWARFLSDVLGRTVHHEPSRGGAEEQQRFAAAYERTLETYRVLFGEPPRDIWPPAATRFGTDLHFRRVNTARNVILPRVRPLDAGLAAAVVALGVTLAWMS